MEVVTITYLCLVFIALYMFLFFILLTYNNRNTIFGYPRSNTNYSISVLIPAHNEEDSIEDTIKHVYNSKYPRENLEIIVLDDGSTDNTAKVVKSLLKKYPNVKLLSKPNSGKADSLNKGIAMAKGELIAVVDSDSFPGPDSLAKLTGYFDDPLMGAVTSFVTVRNDNTLLGKIQALEYLIMAWSRKLLDYVDSVYVTNGPLSLYRKKYILKVGGFDRKTVTEDIEITWNMMNHGYKTGMCLAADVTTIAPSTLKKLYHQRVRWGLGGFQAIAKYKKMFFRKGMFGAFVLPFVSFSILISIFTILFSTYLLFRSFAVTFLVTDYSLSTHSSLLRLEDINLYPSVIIFYFIVLFSFSIFYSLYILKVLNMNSKLTVRRFFNLVFYTIVYLTIYPVVWFPAMYRFVKGDNRW